MYQSKPEVRLHIIILHTLQVLGDLLRVRTLVRQHTAKHDESRTQEYLYASARGDTSQIQQVQLTVTQAVTTSH